MTDPLYTYVKGKGWILESYPTLTLLDGTVVRLEFRAPNQCERYVYFNKRYDYEYFDDNGDLILSKFQSNYSDILDISYFDYTAFNGKTTAENKFYITVIPL